MDRVYISIGSQCSTPLLLAKMGLKEKTLPFDWIISTPNFVYTILKFLLADNLDINDIVDNHFFCIDKRATLQDCEHHITNDTGTVLVNTKYNICFPHDSTDERSKYIRRIERLKELILDKNKFLCFVYVSVSSPTNGNYTLDGIEPIQNLYENINKINELIKTIRDNYKIIVFDTNEPSIESSETLKIIKIKQQNGWNDLLPEASSLFPTI
jgi:hypothetical protein